jgi:hypothetical protein
MVRKLLVGIRDPRSERQQSRETVRLKGSSCVTGLCLHFSFES